MERRVVGLGPLRFFTQGIGHAPIPRTSFPLSDQRPSKGSVTKPPATISIVIPTFRRPEMLQSLLKSLSQGTRIPDEVVVVDNDPDASANPGSIDGLNVRVIHAGLGISLAGARNVGWRSAASDLCFFIDDDNVVEPDAVDSLAEAFLNDNVGLAGPVILAGDSNTIWCAGIARSPWTGQTRCILGGEHDAPSDSMWATDDMPDAFMVRRSVLETLDGFDEEKFPDPLRRIRLHRPSKDVGFLQRRGRRLAGTTLRLGGPEPRQCNGARSRLTRDGSRSPDGALASALSRNAFQGASARQHSGAVSARMGCPDCARLSAS